MSQGESRHCRFGHLEFYAERGMITLVDTKMAQDSAKDPEEYTQRIAPGTFMARAMAAMIQEPDKYPDKLAKLRRLVQDAAEVCKIAKAFGDPTQPSVLEHVIKHQRKSQILLPGSLPDIPMAGLPKERYRLAGSTNSEEILTKGYEVKPDLLLTAAEASAAARSLSRSNK